MQSVSGVGMASGNHQRGTLHRKLAGWLVAWLVCLAVPVLAQDDVVHDARTWLSRLAPAQQATSYRGVFVYARGDQVSSLKVVRRVQEGRIRERLVPQDGGAGEILRNDEAVHCVLPRQGHFLLEGAIPSGPFSDAFPAQREAMNQWYRPVRLEDDRIAGYATAVIDLPARDAWRYSYRLWLELNTALLVKSQVLEANGEVLERFQFSSLEITDQIADDELKGRLIPDQVKAPTADAPHAEHALYEAWTPGWLPPGFTQTADGDRRAYSDGLASFSIFVEPPSGMDMPEGASRIGATTVYMRHWTSDGTSLRVTVVGEVPPATAMKVAEGVRLSVRERQ